MACAGHARDQLSVVLEDGYELRWCLRKHSHFTRLVAVSRITFQGAAVVDMLRSTLSFLRYVLQNSGLCTFSTAIVQPEPKGQLAEASGALRRPVVSGVVLFILFVLGLVSSEVGL